MPVLLSILFYGISVTGRGSLPSLLNGMSKESLTNKRTFFSASANHSSGDEVLVVWWGWHSLVLVTKYPLGFYFLWCWCGCFFRLIITHSLPLLVYDDHLNLSFPSSTTTSIHSLCYPSTLLHSSGLRAGTRDNNVFVWVSACDEFWFAHLSNQFISVINPMQLKAPLYGLINPLLHYPLTPSPVLQSTGYSWLSLTYLILLVLSSTACPLISSYHPPFVPFFSITTTTCEEQWRVWPNTGDQW